ncbi:MAG: antitoxin family protein [Archaeoglobaceae archaeon]
MPKIIEAIYEDGVFKPLEKVDLRRGQRIKIVIHRDKKEIIRKYRGLLGRADAGELKNYEEEAIL